MKTVVITGGTRGLGLELAREFRTRDYNVVICGTSTGSVDNALTKLNECHGKGGICAQVCDVTSREMVQALLETAVKAFGGVDIWINNAGVNQSFCYAWEVDEKEVEFLLDVDLKGAINGSTVAVNHMINQGHGSIYNMEGMGSNDAIQPRFALYGTTKRAVTYFTDALTKELKLQNSPIVVGKLSPGIMITDFLTSSNGKQKQTELPEKTKKVYNILGDYPDVIAKFLVDGIEKNELKKKTGIRIEWLTSSKAAWRFMTAGRNKRDFFN